MGSGSSGIGDFSGDLIALLASADGVSYMDGISDDLMVFDEEFSDSQAQDD